MFRFAPLAALAALFCFTAAQVAAQQTATAQPLYWVFFTDKGDVTRWQPEQILTTRALERRVNQGIALDALDYPVVTEYLNHVKATGAELRMASRWLNAAAVRLSPEQLVAVRQLPCVQQVRPMGYYRVQQASVGSTIATPQASEASGYGVVPALGPNYFPQLDMLNLKKLHEQGHTGRGVVMAVCDDGFVNVDTFQAFSQLRDRGGILGWYDFVDNDTSVFRQGGHGTNVLSTICAVLNDTTADPKSNKGYMQGTAPGVNVWLFRTEQAASETPVEEANWVAAAERADSLGADIIHASLGYSRYDDPYPDHTYEDMNGNTCLITKAADIAAGKGMLIVNSAGNEGDDSWYYITAPADGDSVLTIGAINAEGQIASFSSRGPSYDGRIKPDVVSQGRNTIVVDDATGAATPSNGTSFSGPIIAGFAASVLSSHPSIGGMRLHNAIIQSANQFRGPDNVFGYGLPNAEAAEGYLAMLESGQATVAPDSAARLIVHPHYNYSTLFVNLEKFKGQWMRMEIVVEGDDTRTEWFLVKALHPSLTLYPVTFDNSPVGPQTVRLYNKQGQVVWSGQ